MSPGWLDKEKFIPGLVSVIIPTFNRAAYLKEAIDSVINQTYRPIECIVVDDGSTDNTKELVTAINTDIELRYLYQANTGSQAARNKGTMSSKGEFIQYLDSDDLLYPTKIMMQVNYLQSSEKCDGVFGDWDQGVPDNYKTIKAFKKENLIFQILCERSICIFSLMMRRGIVSKAGEWDISVKRCQEIEFQLNALLKGAQFEYFPLNTGLWRMHFGERIFNKTSSAEVIQFYTKWESFLKLEDKWHPGYADGFIDNYFYFLSEKSANNNKETELLIHEIYRLQPYHPIFRTLKFILTKIAFGSKLAIKLWVIRFRKNINNRAS